MDGKHRASAPARVGCFTAALTIAALSWGSPRVAAAEGGREEEATTSGAPERSGYLVGPDSGWYLLGGATGGASFGPRGAGGFVGGEVSLVRLRRTRWVGAYVDGFYDFSSDRAAFTLGPELGIGPLGFDGGLGLRPGREGRAVELGGQARVLVTAGLFGLFARYGAWSVGGEVEHVAQVGALLKFPLAYRGRER